MQHHLTTGKDGRSIICITLYSTIHFFQTELETQLTTLSREADYFMKKGPSSSAGFHGFARSFFNF